MANPTQTVTLKGTPFPLAGHLPKVGDAAPDFRLVKADLSEVTKASLAGKTVVLLTVPSVDTAVCALETRKFNEKATSIPNVTVVVASADLPFAIKRFCAAEGIQNVHAASDVRDRGFGARWGVAIADGPLAGVTARAAFVIGGDGKVRYVHLVPEIAQEPDYDAVLAAARG
jgi:thiol peroxidase